MNRNTLLIVDDMEVNRAILRSLFESTYKILEAENGEQALSMITQNKETLAVVLLDIVMPVKNGYQVLTEMERIGLLKQIPVVVITAQDSTESEAKAFELGATDMILKPFKPHTVQKRIQNIVSLNRHKQHMEELVEEQAAELQESKEMLMDALISIIEHHSVESGHHVLRIRKFTKVLLEDVMRNCPEYGLDERQVGIISSAAALHDIGKIAIPDSILKKPGALTQEEFEIMKTHTVRGCEILANFSRMHDKEYLQYAYSICRYHHERWDGGGYPESLKSNDIPICAQAVGIADAYDALTTDRIYKKAYSPDKAYEMILNGQCGSFSPRLLECFKNVKQSFADLTRDYADGLLPQTTFTEKSDEDKIFSITGGNLALEQMKYFALLRNQDLTVMELDASTGVYHLVYKQSDDFDTLCSGTLFKKAYENFVNNSVRPADRRIDIDLFIDKFLKSGALKKSFNQQVLHRMTGTYIPYQVTVVRIDTADLDNRRVLIVWEDLTRKSDWTKHIPIKHIPILEDSLVGILICKVDQYFTMVKVNNGVVSLFGYNRDEFKKLFHNRYIELVHPDDRETIKNEISSQMSLSSSFELEYRILTKDGRTLWLLDKCRIFMGEDGVEYIKCVLLDITKTKQDQEELRLSIERHQIIMNQTNDIIFEWDINKRKIFFSSNWVKLFGYEPVDEEKIIHVSHASHLMPEDIPVFKKMVSDISSGAPYGQIEIRIATASGQYLWCRVRATTQFDRQGTPLKAVGVIVNIDDEKRRTQYLIDRADRDSLTQLYNKAAVRQRIEKAMKKSDMGKIGALIILDLDNFKQVNDTRGHMFGDAVLIEVASNIKRLFQSHDIVARIGGDEFLIYLVLPDRDSAIRYVENLISDIRNVLAGDDLLGCPLSCSIGVACYPQDANNFQDLFQCCDRALYHAKSRGKNQFCFCDKKMNDQYFMVDAGQMRTMITQIESNETKKYDANGLVEIAFRLLYRSNDIETAIPLILELVGTSFQLSRVYIIEDNQNGFYVKTFEWRAEGIEHLSGQFEKFPISDHANYRDLFDTNGILYCTDTDKLSENLSRLLKSKGVYSMLQCAIHDNGQFVGSIGFDDCISKRIWNQSQINIITFISELLSTFLLKKRAELRVKESFENLPKLLDAQNSCIYVIDNQTFALLYINARTYQVAPNAEIGVPCYKAFFSRDKVCQNCPVVNLKNNISQTTEIYNPIIEMWTLVDASKIRWNDKDCFLLVCQDITKYKVDRRPNTKSKKLCP